MFGLLNIDKPAGITSRDVVNAVARLVRPAKAGHAGTLDPLATGVLVVCVGQATRLVEYVQQMTKTYQAEFLLGRESDTDDCEGEVRELDQPRIPSRGEVQSALRRFDGEIDQTPPIYSAVKIRGKRAFDLARAGKAVTPATRKVMIYEAAVLAYDYPRLRMRIVCGSGTYIRSIGRDLAHMCGTAAVMSGLNRTAIGGFHVHEAIPFANLAQMTSTDVQKRLLPPTVAVSKLPTLTLQRPEIDQLQNGRVVSLEDTRPGVGGDASLPPRPDGAADCDLAVLDRAQRLAAIATLSGTNQLRPKRCFQIDSHPE